MAAETIVKISAETAQAEAALKRLHGSVGGLSDGFGILSRAMGAMAGLFSISAIGGMANEYTNLQNRLRLVTGSTDELASITVKLFDVAQNTRQGFGETVDMYTRMARASGELGLTQSQLIDLTQTVNNAILVSGASTQEASAGVMQFAQALASGKLQGDELRSILENMPRLAEAIAKGLGITTGELRNLGSEGKLTADVVAKAVLSQSGIVNAEAKTMAITMDQAGTQMKNALMGMVGWLDKTTGFTHSLANAMSELAGVISRMAQQEDLKKSLSYAGQLAEMEHQLNELRAKRNVRYDPQVVAELDKEIARVSLLIETMKRHKQELDKGPLTGSTGGGPDMPAANAMKLESFLSDKGNMSAAQKKQAEMNDLLAGFADAVRGYDQSSAEYLAAYAALQQGIKNIDEKGGKNKSSSFEDTRTADLFKQGYSMDQVANEQAAYDESLRAAQTYHELMNTDAASYAAMREIIEADHQAKLVELGRRGLLSQEQFQKLSGKHQVQIVTGTMKDIIGGASAHSIALFNLHKAAALAEGAVNLQSSVMSAYRIGSEIGGPPVGYAYGTIAFAAQMVNLNAIRAAQFGGGTGGAAPTGGGVSSTAIPGQQANPNIVGGAQVNTAPQQSSGQVSIQLTVQALDPNGITDASLRRIADALSPVLQQNFNRNGQQVQVMV